MNSISFDKDSFKSQLQEAIKKRLLPIFQGSEIKNLLQQQAISLKDLFANSQEYDAIKGNLVGQFGFTPAEVNNLDRILTLMVPDNDITYKTIESVGGVWWAMLEWVNYNKLKSHSYAQHELTRIDPVSGIVTVTSIVSWIQWLEEGISVADHAYMRANRFNRANSRSEVGLMCNQPGFTFVIPPSRIFERLGYVGGKLIESNLRKGLGILVRGS